MTDENRSSYIYNKTLDQLNLCLKTAQMGIWESVLSKNPLSSLSFKWDEEVSRMHGVPPGQEVVPLEWFRQHLHPEDLESLVHTTLHHISNLDASGPIAYNYRMIWPNGEVHYIEMRGNFDRATESPTQIKIYGVAKDITQDVVKQKLIDDQKNRLLAASRMTILGEISGGIAHEINNPLTVIQARAFQLLQMAETGNLDPARVKSAVESISKTGDKIAKIINSLRAVTQRKKDDPLDRVFVHELLQETLDLCQSRFYNHGIEIRLKSIPENLELECHLVQIEEALLNIFNNAHDAVAKLKEKWIEIEAFDENHNVEIHVTDSGTDIPENVKDSMMLPFFSTKEIGKGLGLGLSIVSEIMTKHHGVAFLDRTSANTKFVLRLPKVQPKNLENKVEA